MPAKILLVDDDLVVHTAVKKSLTDNFELFDAMDSTQALSMIDEIDPDVVLLDVEMPGMNGYECCEIIKSKEQFKQTPVVFLSARTSINERLLGYEAGADDYLVKPFEKDELEAKLKVWSATKYEREMLEAQKEAAETTAFEAITGSSEIGRVMRFVELTYGIKKLDTLGAQLVDLFKSFDLRVVMLFETELEGERAYSSSQVKPLEMELLEQCRHKNRFIDFGCRTIINYPKISLLIKNMPLDDPEKYGRYKDLFPTVLGATDAKIRAMESYHGLNMQAQRTQQAFMSIRQSLVKLADEKNEVTENVRKMMTQYSMDMSQELPPLGLEDDQEAFILKKLDEAMINVSESLDLGKQLHETLLAMSREMEISLSQFDNLLQEREQDEMFTQGEELTVESENYEMDVELF